MNKVKASTKTTLLLNNAYQPINLVSAGAALIQLMKGNVAALDKNFTPFHSMDKWRDGGDFHDDQPYITSATELWMVPTIIVVTTKYFHRPKKKRLSLHELALVHDYTCQYCLEKFPLKELTIDHIFPRSKGGEDYHENRTLACRKCNSEKGSEYPVFDINGKKVKAPQIPQFLLRTKKIRGEWRQFVKL